MVEDALGEMSKGLLKGMGYLLADVFFWKIGYWVGWPVCKLVTGGRYPTNPKRSHFWCALTGISILIGFSLYFIYA